MQHALSARGCVVCKATMLLCTLRLPILQSCADPRAFATQKGGGPGIGVLYSRISPIPTVMRVLQYLVRLSSLALQRNFLSISSLIVRRSVFSAVFPSGSIYGVVRYLFGLLTCEAMGFWTAVVSLDETSLRTEDAACSPHIC